MVYCLPTHFKNVGDLKKNFGAYFEEEKKHGRQAITYYNNHLIEKSYF